MVVCNTDRHVLRKIDTLVEKRWNVRLDFEDSVLDFKFYGVNQYHSWWAKCNDRKCFLYRCTF